jgi:hypothetical protein
MRLHRGSRFEGLKGLLSGTIKRGEPSTKLFYSHGAGVENGKGPIKSHYPIQAQNQGLNGAPGICTQHLLPVRRDVGIFRSLRPAQTKPKPFAGEDLGAS